MVRVRSLYRYVKEPWASYRVERRSDGAVMGWVNKDPFGEGWIAHRSEGGDYAAGGFVDTREEAAENLARLRAGDD